MAIAAVIALGTGTFAGLSASAEWRRVSYDASYEVTNAHDVLVSLAQNTTVDDEALRAALDTTPHPEWFEDLTTSLVVNVQVDASTADEIILVPGRLVGVEVARTPTPPVDTLSVAGGRGLDPTDDGADVVVMDARFANARDLPATGTLRLGGDREVPWVGTGQSPRYFLPASETGSVLGASGLAVLYHVVDQGAGRGGHSGPDQRGVDSPGLRRRSRTGAS